MKDFKDLEAAYERMVQLGHKLEKHNLEKLQELEAKAIANPKVKAFYEAGAAFQKLMVDIDEKIREGITGRPAKDPDTIEL